MNFWGYINGENKTEQNKRFSYEKWLIVSIFVFLLIPFLVYYIIVWNPIIGTDEYEEPVRFGVYLVIGLYWFALYIDYKRYESKKRLSKLLDKLFNESDSQFEQTIDLIKNKREVIKDDSISDYRNEGEERLKWFNIS